MSQESDVCCTTSMYDIQNRCIPDEIDLFYFKTCIITHNNNVIEQNINVSMFDILSVKEPHSFRPPRINMRVRVRKAVINYKQVFFRRQRATITQVVHCENCQILANNSHNRDTMHSFSL